jgi:hypothetical protein
MMIVVVCCLLFVFGTRCLDLSTAGGGGGGHSGLGWPGCVVASLRMASHVLTAD